MRTPAFLLGTRLVCLSVHQTLRGHGKGCTLLGGGHQAYTSLGWWTTGLRILGPRTYGDYCRTEDRIASNRHVGASCQLRVVPGPVDDPGSLRGRGPSWAAGAVRVVFTQDMTASWATRPSSALRCCGMYSAAPDQLDNSFFLFRTC